MTTKKYNIYDIAEELQLAPSTISKAINETGSVSKKTREKVLSYIKEKGYSPNLAASALKSRTGYVIGILYPTRFPDITNHFFFSRIIETFRQYIEKAGYEFTFVSHYLGTHEVSYLDFCINRNIDGVLVLGATKEDADVMEVVRSGIPCVSLDYLDNNVPFVQTDDDMAASYLIEFIKNKHYHNITYLTGPYLRGDFKKRTEKFKNMISDNIKDINLFVYEAIEADIDDAKLSIIEYLKNNKLPDVVVCSNDEIAFGAIYGIMECGYKVPEDISVIGFDDMYFAKYFNPSLTTISQDYVTIAYCLSATLLDILQGKKNILKEQYINCKLIERNSTK